MSVSEQSEAHLAVTSTFHKLAKAAEPLSRRRPSSSPCHHLPTCPHRPSGLLP